MSSAPSAPASMQKPSSGYYIPIANIDLNQLGAYGGLHLPYNQLQIQELERYATQRATQLAIQTNIVTNINRLTARDVLPDKDFVDIAGNTITSRGWRQPWSGTYETTETDLTVYKINRTVDYHTKTYAFWGVRLVNTGPGREGGVTDAASITWKDNVNTLDVWHVEALDTNQELYTFKPIVIKNFTDITVSVRPKITGSGQFDNFQLMGKVIEPRGNTIVGSMG